MVLIQSKEKTPTNSFKKDISKLMNNSTFGKTMEILRKIINFSLVNNAWDYKKCVSNFHEIKPVLTLNKPIYIGFSILDLIKLLMYEFHYKYIKKKFKANLLLKILLGNG